MFVVMCEYVFVQRGENIFANIGTQSDFPAAVLINNIKRNLQTVTFCDIRNLFKQNRDLKCL